MLSCLVQVQANLFLDTDDLCQGHIGLPHILNSLHEHSCMRALLRFEPNCEQMVDLATNLAFVEVRVQRLQVLAHGIQQAEQKGHYSLNHIDLDLRVGLYQLLFEIVRRLHSSRNVD